MSRRKPTQAQKKAAAERRAKLKALVAQVSKMTEDERSQLIERFGAIVTCEGRPLSFYNTCLILTQNETASMVGGFRQWLTAGRCVCKGEKALAIWIPSRGKAEEPGDEETELRFRMGNVFDISQTKELEEEAAA